VDDVLLEVRKIREAYATVFDYDLGTIHRSLKEQERASGRRIVSLPARRPKAALRGVSAERPDPRMPGRSDA
jgi:hypothetical protein